MEITEDEFKEYVKVQKSGRTNMFDVRMVEALSGLPSDKIFIIMKTYGELSKKFKKVV